MKELKVRPIGLVKNQNKAEILKYEKEDINLDHTLIEKQGIDLKTSVIKIIED
ncbi:MAG: hypothetical protein GF353_10965, partial [Candidatus Lokiarchaeota archaeon]|nr:hypothetical protein [Candidatus Lokiarchaeota archaeon]